MSAENPALGIRLLTMTLLAGSHTRWRSTRKPRTPTALRIFLTGRVGVSGMGSGKGMSAVGPCSASIRVVVPCYINYYCCKWAIFTYVRVSMGIVNLADPGRLLRPRSVRTGQHNRRAKDLP